MSMTQTASTKKQPEPIDKFKAADPLKKQLIWLYYLGEQSAGAQGLKNTGTIGRKDHYGEAGNLKFYIESSNFYYLAKVSILCCPHQARSNICIHLRNNDGPVLSFNS